jgi:hypothetical protein
MKDLDQKIQAALRADSSGETFGREPNLAEEVITVFRGRHRLLTTLMMVINVAALGGMIWAVVRFCTTTDVSEQLRWGGLGAVLLALMTMLKLWFWLEMQTNRVLREVKRVELLLVSKSS